MKIIDELKPCPFCGGKACACGNQDCYVVHCQDCGCVLEHDKEFKEPEFPRFKSLRSAVDNWNKREQSLSEDAEVLDKITPQFLRDNFCDWDGYFTLSNLKQADNIRDLIKQAKGE